MFCLVSLLYNLYEIKNSLGFICWEVSGIYLNFTKPFKPPNIIVSLDVLKDDLELNSLWGNPSCLKNVFILLLVLFIRSKPSYVEAQM